MISRFLIVSSLIISSCINAWANNLLVEIQSLESTSENTVGVHCKVSWSNSWDENSSIENHDATWLFFKSKNNGDKKYQSAKISSFYSNDFELHKSKDSLGLIVKSNSSESNGQIYIELDLNQFECEIFVGGIEMVYVPQASYYLGDAVSNHSFENVLSEPIKIQNEAALRFGDDISSSTWASLVGDIPANFPKGFDGFYCMKYELSQNQFADFLNHLAYDEQSKIMFIAPNSDIGKKALFTQINSYFNTLTIKQKGNATSNLGAIIACDLNNNLVFDEGKDGQDLACNFLSWIQLLYYLDWSGLRPMTEMEFEKAARGSLNSIPKEFAFGSDKVKDANTLKYDSTSFETYDMSVESGIGIASHGYSGRQGPIRVGFAAKDTTTRLSSGASFWGIMELSGNLWEQTVGVNKSNGLLFTGSHGDGDVNSLPLDWKPEASILRGGAWNSGIGPTYRDLSVSDRYYYNLSSELARNTTGGRGVRSLNSFEK